MAYNPCVAPNNFPTALRLLLLLGCLTRFTTLAQTTVLFPDFSNISTLQLNGNASIATTTDGSVLQLTPHATNQAGSAFLLNPVPLASDGSFSAFFTFRLLHPSGNGGDGIAFVVQSVGSSSLGAVGGGLGYLGITNSLCVEYDTYKNTVFQDPNNNHVGVNFNGVLGGSIHSLVADPMENGNIWYSWIDYNGATGGLEVRLSETSSRPASPILASVINLSNYLVGTNVYFGFTGGTGASFDEQDVLSWQLTVTNPPSTPSDQFIIEAGGYSSVPSTNNGQNEIWYASVGFGHSTATPAATGCTPGIGSDYGTHGLTNPPISTVTLSPQFQIPGGRYRLEAEVPTTSNKSTDLQVSLSSSNSTGLPASTQVFASGNIDQWLTIGTLQLTNGATNDTIKLSYAAGTIDGSHRWYSAAYRFTHVNDPVTTPPLLTNTPAGFAFATSTHATNSEDVFGLALDAQHNIYISGYYSGVMNFGPTNFTAAGLIDMYLAKYDRAGNFLWAKTGGGTTNDVAYSVAVDNAGNAYVTGRFGRTATFDGVSLTSAGDEEIFLAKYDTNGNLIWIKRAGAAGYDFGRKIVLDESGNIYFTGAFKGNATFGTLTVPAIGVNDVLIAKYDPNGNPIWIQHYGGAGGWDEGYGLARDSSGNLYVSGRFQKTIYFGATSLTSAGGEDIFVAKFDSSGNPLWAASAGGTDDDRSTDIAVDKAGNVFATGWFVGPGNFGTTTPGDGTTDMFLAKYDSSGNLSWTRFGRSNSDDEGDDLKTDSAGNIYVTGFFNNVAEFYPYEKTSVGGRDGFLAKYDTYGNVLSLRQLSSGGSATEIGRVLSIDANDSVFWAGVFGGTVNFGTTNLTSAGGLDVFITRIDEIPTIGGMNVSVAANQFIFSWSSNYLGFTLQTSTNLITWIDATNQPVMVNGQYTVTDALSCDRQLFRLRK